MSVSVTFMAYPTIFVESGTFSTDREIHLQSAAIGFLPLTAVKDAATLTSLIDTKYANLGSKTKYKHKFNDTPWWSYTEITSTERYGAIGMWHRYPTAFACGTSARQELSCVVVRFKLYLGSECVRTTPTEILTNRLPNPNRMFEEEEKICPSQKWV